MKFLKNNFLLNFFKKDLFLYFFSTLFVSTQVAFFLRNYLNKDDNVAVSLTMLLLILLLVVAILYILTNLIFIIVGRESYGFSVQLWILSSFFLTLAIFLINLDILLYFKIDKLTYILFTVSEIIPPILAAILFFLVAEGIGEKCLKVFKIRDIPYLDKILFSFGLGVALIGYISYLISSLHWAYPSVIYGIFFFFLIFSWREFLNFLKYIFGKRININLDRKNTWSIYAVIFNSLLLIITFIFSLANIASGKWDTFHQYLTFPAAYAANHGLVYFPYHPHWGFPQQGEMIFLTGILLGGITVSFILNYFFVFLGIGGMLVAVSKFGKKNILWTGSLIISIPMFLTFLSGYLKIESLLIFYSALLFLAGYHLFYSRGKTRYFILVYIYLGLLLAIKYTSLLAVVSFFIAVWFFRKELSLSIKKVFLGFIIIGLLFLPWAIKDVVYYKNPTYLMISGGTDYFIETLGIDCHKCFLENSSEDMFLLGENSDYKFPIHLFSTFIVGLSFFVSTYPVNLTSPGPWLLIFLFFFAAIGLKIENKFIKFMGFFSASFFVLWLLLLYAQAWYLLPMLVALFIALGYVFEKHYDISRSPFMKSIILIWLFFSIIMLLIFGSYREKIKYIRGELDYKSMSQLIKESQKEGFRYKWLRTWNYVNKLTAQDPEAKIYSFFDAQGFFIKDSYRTFIPDFYGYLFRCMRENGDVREQMKKLNIKYIIIPENFQSFSKKCRKEGMIERFQMCKAQVEFQNFLAENGEKIHREGSVVIYRLK